MANLLSNLRHFLRDGANMLPEEAADFTRSVRRTGVSTKEEENELINYLSGLHEASGTDQELIKMADSSLLSKNVQKALDVPLYGNEKNTLRDKILQLGAAPVKINQRQRILEERYGRQVVSKNAAPPKIKSNEPVTKTVQSSSDFPNAELGLQAPAFPEELQITPPNQLGGHAIKTSPLPKKTSIQSEIDAANPLGTPESREAEIAEAKRRMKGQEEAVKMESQKSSFFQNAKDNLKAFKNKYSDKPNEFQQATTEMVSKFSGGRYTGAVNTEKMNWLEAGAQKNLHESIARKYDNLIAKMQGAKDQESFSKLMEENKINYKEGMSGEELEKNINAHFDERLKSGPGFGNYMLGNKVASGGMLLVAGASALALADSKGRRSNNDLYSSQI